MAAWHLRTRIKKSALLIIAPVVFYFIGAAMNRIAITANYGAMPVLVPRGWSEPTQPGGLLDSIHTAWNKDDVRVKFLCDWIQMPDKEIDSPGDLLIDGADWLRWPLGFAWFFLQFPRRKRGHQTI